MGDTAVRGNKCGPYGHRENVGIGAVVQQVANQLHRASLARSMERRLHLMTNHHRGNTCENKTAQIAKRRASRIPSLVARAEEAIVDKRCMHEARGESQAVGVFITTAAKGPYHL